MASIKTKKKAASTTTASRAKATKKPKPTKASKKPKPTKASKKPKPTKASKKPKLTKTSKKRKRAARTRPSAPRVADVKTVAEVGPRSTTTLVQHVFIQATPEQVYDALTDPTLASTITGGECTGAPVAGGAFTQWNGYIQGKHLELVRGERIVQEWSTTEWPRGAAPSRVEFQLAGTGGGTELTMTHAQVPSAQAESYRQGWIDFTWVPMRAHFGSA